MRVFLFGCLGGGVGGCGGECSECGGGRYVWGFGWGLVGVGMKTDIT